MLSAPTTSTRDDSSGRRNASNDGETGKHYDKGIGMIAASIVGKQVKVLCGKCGKRIRSVEAVNERWVRAHCLRAGSLEEWLPFVSSNEHCRDCKEGWLF